LHFLLAATGFEETEKEVNISQLAMDVDELRLDPILMQWATTHYSSVQKVAGLYDRRRSRRNEETPIQNMDWKRTSQEPGKTGRAGLSEPEMGMTQNANTGSWQGSRETANPVQGSARPKENLGCNNTRTGTGGIQETVATSAGMAREVLGVNREDTPNQTINQGGFMNYQGPGQIWTGGPQANGLPPFPQYPNPWYPFHPQVPSMNMGPPTIPTQQNVVTAQQTTQNNDASTKELFVNAFRSMFAEEMESSATPHGISASGKSTKILNGVNRDSVKGFCGKTFIDDVPDIFKILDGNKNITTKKQAVEDKLREAQSMNAMVKFTL